MELDEWFASQPEGAMTRMLHDLIRLKTPVSWATICRAKRRQAIREKSAAIISAYTKGKVSVPTLLGQKQCGECGRSYGETRPRRRRGRAAKKAARATVSTRSRAAKGRSAA